jgi:ABC-2 type transport system ATP-binding protein
VPYRSLRWPLRTVGAVLDARAFHPGRSARGHLAALAAGGGIPRRRAGVLLLDEPVNGLDPSGVRWIRDLVRSLAAEGRTVFVSSHLISEMTLTADRLIVIGRGRLLADTTVSSLAARGGGSLEDAFLALTEGSVEYR